MQEQPGPALGDEPELRGPGGVLLPAHAGRHDLQCRLLLRRRGRPGHGPFFIFQLAVRGDPQLGGLLPSAGILTGLLGQQALPEHQTLLHGAAGSEQEATFEPGPKRAGPVHELELQSGSGNSCHSDSMPSQ